MKIFTLLALCLILSSAAISQINKGQFLAGGSFSFESEENAGANVVNYKTSTFLVSPAIGYFIIPKLAGGLRLNFAVYKQNYPASSKQVYASLSPFVRYYLLSQKQKFNVLVDAAYINFKSKSRFSNSSTTYFERRNGYTISIGPSFFLNEYVALEFLVSYKQTKVKDTDDYKTNKFNTGLGLQIHIGKLKTKGKVS